MLDFIPPPIWEGLITAFKYTYWLAPLWLPLLFLTMLWRAWIYYRRAKFWQSQGNVVLEIKLPKEIMKSPVAMELILGAMYQTGGEGNWYQKYWLGQTRPWFSLEIISQGGNIRFFLWMRKNFKSLLETNLYSQYPGIEVYEVEDYAKEVYFDPTKHKFHGVQWELSQPDPFPIKTYVDYGLDKDPKEEFKTDPMSTSLEFLSTLTKGHTVWIQIIVRAHKKEQKKALPWAKKWEKFAWYEVVDDWKDEAKRQVEDIRKGLAGKEGAPGRPPSRAETEKIDALERSVSKLAFDVGIRSIYFADESIYNGMYVGGLMGYFKQYSSANLNGFKPAGWYSAFSYPLADWWKSNKDFPYLLLEEYKLRRFFFSPHLGSWYYSKPFVLNTEELATIYHFPGATAAAPTFERVPSKKSEAPSNLPI